MSHKACEVRYVGGDGQRYAGWQRFASMKQAAHAFPELAGQVSALINKDQSRCSKSNWARFEARRVPARDDWQAQAAQYEAVRSDRSE